MSANREDMGNASPNSAHSPTGKATTTTTTTTASPEGDHEDTEYERLFGTSELGDQPPTTRRELWSYYLYYNGISPPTISLKSTAHRIQATTESVQGHTPKPCMWIAPEVP